MSTILDTIIANKKKEIERLKPLSSIERFAKEGFFWKTSPRSLVNSLLNDFSTGIIAEFKRKSPSKGWFHGKELEVEPVVVPYNNLGAAGISVLTDEEFFGGDLDDLIQTSIVSDLPVLRKDFIIDRWQIAESRAFGAHVILLIAACLSKEEVKQMAGYAKSIGLEVLLEIHKEKELEHICDDVDIVGVNNRNLDNFEVNVETSLQLIELIPKGVPAISESGITEIQTLLTLKKAGFKGFLMGENFMRTKDPGLAFEKFVVDLRSSQYS